MLQRFIAFCCLMTIGLAQPVIQQRTQGGDDEIYEGLIAGVGPGTFSVMATAVLGIIACIFKDCSPMPKLVVGIAFLMPIALLGLLRSLPVEALQSEEESKQNEPKSVYLFKTGFMSFLIYAAALSLCVITLCTSFTAQALPNRVQSSGISLKDSDNRQDSNKAT